MNTNKAKHTDKGYALKNLYLDPNNYRFLDKNDYAKCDDETAVSKTVQNRTSDLLTGKNNNNISDLIASFIKNGYIPVDQIQVRKVAHQKYVVIEGNRRIAALKVLEQMHIDSKDIGNFDPEMFKKVPVVDYDGEDPAMFKVLMGLKHISGNKKWPAINQAKLLASLYEEHGMSENDIYKSLGISKIEMRATRRTLSLINRYEESDYGDQFQSEKYSTFREIIKSPPIKDWLELSPTDIDIKNVNEQNLDRLFSWISTTEEEIEDEDIDSEDTHIINQEPIIETALQVRELAKIISDKNALQNLETTRNLIDATLSSETLGKNKLENALSLMKQQINIAFNYSYLIDDEKLEGISESIKKMNALRVTRNKSEEDTSSNPFNKKPIVESCNTHFTDFNIEKYKRFEDLDIKNLNRVNIFAGINNAGKSSLLEAFYMMTKLGDTQALQVMNKHRKKHHGDLKYSNIFGTLPSKIAINASFNNKAISLDSYIDEDTDSEVENKAGFIGRFTSNCQFIDNLYIYHSDYYDKKVQHHATTNYSLCNSVISFSTSIDDEMVFIECYKKAVSNGTKAKVINFIKENIDPSLDDIELSDNDGTFIVTYDDPRLNMDLSLFGDGLQKIFYLGIKFAACSNGVLLLDEIENGIHKDLLCQFTKLIQELADQYNVQVFATSHSKECIDAFISNDFKNEQISAYAIDSSESKVEHFSGEDLEELIDYINLDIRGTKQ
ncbi:AAA family ATPase [Vibrio cyclitrophicus]|uniref:AAA family ATPase n=1 Tax=Vibrio lentus TaxID=136468 RepID=UPI003552A784